MAWNCRMAMGTGGSWSRTGRSATLGMSGWHRLWVQTAAERKCSALNMSEYCYMLCALGVPARRCASDRYSIGWCLGSIHEMSAKHSMGRCPITDSALDVRNIEGVIWEGRIFLCDAWG
ncbi:surface protease GP63 [Trypanosoma cruzi]|nr:surface protease GP63 [Trypanosoma cruzi]